MGHSLASSASTDFTKNVGRLKNYYLKSRIISRFLNRKYIENNELKNLYFYFKLLNKKRLNKSIISPIFYQDSKDIKIEKIKQLSYNMKKINFKPINSASGWLPPSQLKRLKKINKLYERAMRTHLNQYSANIKNNNKLNIIIDIR